MNPIEKLQNEYKFLTKSEQKLADFITNNPKYLLKTTISSITKQAGSSNAALVRLCKKLGYNGFSEFKFSIHRYLLSHDIDLQDNNSKDSIKNLISIYTKYLNEIPKFINSEQIQEVAKLICSAKRICIWGHNRTYQSVQQLSHRLCRLGIFNKCTDDMVVMMDDAEILTNNDLCIIISVNGQGFKQYESIANTLKERGCATVLITMNSKQPIAQWVEYVLTLPWISNDNSTNFYEDQIIIYMALEIILYEVAKIASD